MVTGASSSVTRDPIVAGNGDLSYERVLAHCRAHLGEPKIPRSVLFLAELPRDARGKLDRAALARPRGPELH